MVSRHRLRPQCDHWTSSTPGVGRINHDGRSGYWHPPKRLGRRKNITLENRFAAEHYERFDGLAAELVELKVDVLVPVTQPAALAAQRATTTIPIVFILVPDPVLEPVSRSLKATYPVIKGDDWQT
jgi:hypothetical protein